MIATEASDAIVSAEFVENHIHLDYADTAGQPRQNESGTLFEGIGLWAERKELGLNDVDGMRERALTAVRRAVAHGYGAIRTHALAGVLAELGAEVSSGDPIEFEQAR